MKNLFLTLVLALCAGVLNAQNIGWAFEEVKESCNFTTPEIKRNGNTAEITIYDKKGEKIYWYFKNGTCTEQILTFYGNSQEGLRNGLKLLKLIESKNLTFYKDLGCYWVYSKSREIHFSIEVNNVKRDGDLIIIYRRFDINKRKILKSYE